MKPIIHDTIDQLQRWKDAYFNGEVVAYEDREYEDLLDNIMVGKHKCYASHLFSQLTEADKDFISKNIDFYIDFENLLAVYSDHKPHRSSKGGAK